MNSVHTKRRPVLALFEWHHAGDAVLALPYVRTAEQQYEVHVFCRPEVEEIFHFILPASRVHGCRPAWCHGGFLSSLAGVFGCRTILEQVRRVAADTAVCAWADPRVFSLMTRAGIARRVGFPVTKKNYFTSEVALEKPRLMRVLFYNLLATLLCGKTLLTDKINRLDYRQARWEDWRQIGQEMGLSVSMQIPWFVPPIPLPPEVEARFSKIKCTGDRIWLVHPGARLAVKRWPAARFTELIEARLKTGGVGLFVVDPPDGNALPDGAASGWRIRAENYATLAALIHASDAVLCHDSLPAHLAAALGKPVVTLFGDMPDCWFSPYGNREFVVGSKGSIHSPLRAELEKSGRTLLDAVTVESVLQAMKQVEDQTWRK